MRALNRRRCSVVAVVVLAGCNDGTAGDPPTLEELPDRIAASQEAEDLMVVLGCTPEHWRETAMDFEGTADRSTAEELESAPIGLRVPGRIRALRDQGKIVFLDLHDGRSKQRHQHVPQLPTLQERLHVADTCSVHGGVRREARQGLKANE